MECSSSNGSGWPCEAVQTRKLCPLEGRNKAKAHRIALYRLGIFFCAEGSMQNASAKSTLKVCSAVSAYTVDIISTGGCRLRLRATPRESSPSMYKRALWYTRRPKWRKIKVHDGEFLNKTSAQQSVPLQKSKIFVLSEYGRHCSCVLTEEGEEVKNINQRSQNPSVRSGRFQWLVARSASCETRVYYIFCGESVEDHIKSPMKCLMTASISEREA